MLGDITMKSIFSLLLFGLAIASISAIGLQASTALEEFDFETLSLEQLVTILLDEYELALLGESEHEPESLEKIVTALLEESEYNSALLDEVTQFILVNDSTVECGDIITEDTTLTRDLTGCTGHGLIISAHDITLDCAGHVIQGVNFNNSGVHIGDGRSGFNGISVKNCEIRNFNIGIDMSGTLHNNNIKNNILRENLWGLSVFHSYNANFSNNIFINNSYGIYMFGSINITISGNDMSYHEGTAILVRGGYNEFIYGNTFSNNPTNVFFVYGSDSVVEYNNFHDGLVGEYDSLSGISALNNYWNTTNCVEIESRIYGMVPYEPFLDAPYPDGEPMYCPQDSDGDGIPDDEDVCPDEDATGFDADKDGCIDTLDGLHEIIETLPDDVLADEIKNSLVSKVNNALNSVDKEKDDAAINMLEAFINQIEAQSGNKISTEVVEMITTYVVNIIAQIITE